MKKNISILIIESTVTFIVTSIAQPVGMSIYNSVEVILNDIREKKIMGK